MNVLDPKNGLIYMKVGLHAQESIEDIIKRKRHEYERTGMIFWGYGGNTCHPTAMVQPFAKQVVDRKGQIVLVMHKMDSRHNAPPALAKEYSDDGINWRPIPRDIQVLGSRYALVLGMIEDSSLELPLTDLAVAIGRSRGNPAERYLRGRVDKGCFELSASRTDEARPETTHIDLLAPVQAPYAVFLR